MKATSSVSFFSQLSAEAMHLHYRRFCLLLQAVSMVVGLSEVLNPSSIPSPSTSTLKLATTLDYGLNATFSSTFFNGFSTPGSLVLNATLPSSNASSLKALSSDDSSIAKNVDGNVNVYGPGTINVTLNNGQLSFGYCVDCFGKVLVCYDSDTIVPPSSHNDPRSLCGNSGQCGFQIEMNAQDVYAMGDKGGASKNNWLKAEGKCPITTMSDSKVEMHSWFQSCAPKIVNGVVTLNIKSVMDTCPLKIVGAKLKPKEVSTTPGPTHNDSTTEGSSSAATIWIVVCSIIFGLFLLALVIFAIWFFKLRHRKAKPAKNDPESAIIDGPPTNKSQLQVQVKDEGKNDSAAAGLKVPTKSESKIAAAPPKSESKVAVDAPAKVKVDEPAKVKAEEAPQDKLKITEVAADVPAKPKIEEDAKVKAEGAAEKKLEPVKEAVAGKIAEPPMDPAVRNENIQARAKSALKTFSLRSARSAKSGQKKPDSALLRLQASNEYRILAPIHSLDRLYGIYPRGAKHNAGLYPRGYPYSKEIVEALLLAPVPVALETCQKLSTEARKILVDNDVEFDVFENTKKVPYYVRRMVYSAQTMEHVKAYLFIAEYGKDFYPTPDVLPKYSASLLFFISMSPRYSDQLREAAIVEMRRHLPVVRNCWSSEECKKWNFPLNAIHMAYGMNKRAFLKNGGIDCESSSSSGRKAGEKRRGASN